MEAKIKITVTLFGKTKEIEIQPLEGQNKAFSDSLFTARCGRTGAKRWLAFMVFWLHGDEWKPDYSFCQLNRNTGKIYAWAEDAAWTAGGSGKVWQERFGKAVK